MYPQKTPHYGHNEANNNATRSGDPDIEHDELNGLGDNSFIEQQGRNNGGQQGSIYQQSPRNGHYGIQDYSPQASQFGSSASNYTRFTESVEHTPQLGGFQESSYVASNEQTSPALASGFRSPRSAGITKSNSMRTFRSNRIQKPFPKSKSSQVIHQPKPPIKLNILDMDEELILQYGNLFELDQEGEAWVDRSKLDNRGLFDLMPYIKR